MSKKEKDTRWQNLKKQQQEILDQITAMKKEISSLIRSMERIEARLEMMGNRHNRKKNRLLSFPRNKTEKRETASNPLSIFGTGDLNLIQVMELLKNPAVQKMLQKFLS